ncbi:hypothetical protein [Streptomyces cupreus]|uniref:Uncharacterized protein n=1 Tax=Streptomyces cupreus TaxID=2759956 RepID=A0A7X1MC55_9ACTN|nr:hypothetical protein [Streptomyces cupreus]MBC2906099.1 hypothetical protein [Streptomyces cupreus]
MLPDPTGPASPLAVLQLVRGNFTAPTWKQQGRRARKGDGIYTVRTLLRRSKEDLTEEQLALLNIELDHTGTYGRQIHVPATASTPTCPNSSSWPRSEGNNRTSSSSKPATPSPSRTERTSASGHAAQPPAEAGETRTPINFEDPACQP